MKHIFDIFTDFLDVKKLAFGWIAAPLTHFLSTYVFLDWHFLVNILIVVGIDTVFGIMVAFKLKKISSQGFSGIFNKIIVYGLVLIATHTAAHIPSGSGQITAILGWMDAFVYSIIIVREILSIFEKTTILGYFKPPKWLTSKLEYFNDNGEFIHKKDTQE